MAANASNELFVNKSRLDKGAQFTIKRGSIGDVVQKVILTNGSRWRDIGRSESRASCRAGQRKAVGHDEELSCVRRIERASKAKGRKRKSDSKSILIEAASTSLTVGETGLLWRYRMNVSCDRRLSGVDALQTAGRLEVRRYEECRRYERCQRDRSKC